MGDIVERLGIWLETDWQDGDDASEAAGDLIALAKDEIEIVREIAVTNRDQREALYADKERLRAALQPFANIAKEWCTDDRDPLTSIQPVVSVEDLERVRVLIAFQDRKEDGDG